jgi:hypothetical protein
MPRPTNTDKETAMQIATVLAPLLLAALAAGCASTQPPRLVTDPKIPVAGVGFSILPPGGERWLQAVHPTREAVMFFRADPDNARRGGTIVASAVRVQLSRPDVRSAAQLQAEFDASVRAPSARHTLISANTAVYADTALGMDCVRIATEIEERDNPNLQGQVLLISTFGKACQQPSSPPHYVMATCSERRVAGSAALIDETLRRQCDRSIESLRFQPIP